MPAAHITNSRRCHSRDERGVAHPRTTATTHRSTHAPHVAHTSRHRLHAFQVQISKNGEGRLNKGDDDPRLWLPTMLSPALGNPSAHTLREFHYQSRCMRLISRHEAR
mgnify:CR=1 FL=1